MRSPCIHLCLYLMYSVKEKTFKGSLDWGHLAATEKGASLQWSLEQCTSVSYTWTWRRAERWNLVGNLTFSEEWFNIDASSCCFQHRKKELRKISEDAWLFSLFVLSSLSLGLDSPPRLFLQVLAACPSSFARCPQAVLRSFCNELSKKKKKECVKAQKSRTKVAHREDGAYSGCRQGHPETLWLRVQFRTFAEHRLKRLR